MQEHECPDCRRSFKTGPALISHRRTHKNAHRVEDESSANRTMSAEMEPIQFGTLFADKLLAGEVLPEPVTWTCLCGRVNQADWISCVKCDAPRGPHPACIAARNAPKSKEYEEYLENMRSYYPTGFGTPDLSGRPVDPDAYAPTTVRIKKLAHGKDLPDLARATSGSAAVDLYAAIDKPVCVGVNEREVIPTGIAIEVPTGFVAKVVPRSGLAFNHGISLTNTPGIIDADYRGEIKLSLINHSNSKFWVNRGDRVAQMLIERVEPVQFEYVEELSDTERGTGGFGSSGGFGT